MEIGECLVVEEEDDRGLVKCPYLSMMEWTERRRTESASLWKVRMTEVWGRSFRWRSGALHHSSLQKTRR